MSPEAIADRSRVHATMLIAKARADSAELTAMELPPAPVPATYDVIHGPLTECAGLLEQIARRLIPLGLQPLGETAKDSRE